MKIWIYRNIRLLVSSLNVSLPFRTNCKLQVQNCSKNLKALVFAGYTMYVQRDNESLSHNNIHSDKMDLSHV